MRAFLSTPEDSERAPHPTPARPARPRPLCTEHRLGWWGFGQASGLCEAVLLWGVGCPWMRPPRVWGPGAAVGGPVQRAPGSAGRRREGASRRGAWLHPAGRRWASLGVAGCSVLGVTKEAGGNPGTAGVLEAKTEAQGTAVEVRCCPEVRTVMRPGLRPRPPERALPGPSTGEPAPAPGLLRAGHADRGGLGVLGASPSSCAWTEPGVRETREPQAGLATLQASRSVCSAWGGSGLPGRRLAQKRPWSGRRLPAPVGPRDSWGYDVVSGGGWPGAVGHHAPPLPVCRLVATCTKPSAPLSRLVWGCSWGAS
ncbi:uncharacterized protein LOC118881379 [Balaenoptera musculus]|uniref:Uncharacterized protein LOC118881379 n=1 Tax=Balaenoptera musculus TaxID=9771 RepID=A0A8B8VB89_BALMU|nr:uncharacterized protein LOC118881379 [Balaenoptera musculus]